MSKAKGNEDAEAAPKKKTGKAKGGRIGGEGVGGGPIVGGGQFVASDSSNNRDASLLPEEAQSSNVSGTDNSFLYSVDESNNAPKKKNKKTRAKIQKSNDDEEEEDNRERYPITDIKTSDYIRFSC